MKLSDLKIGTRLAMLAGFLMLAMLAVGLEGWGTLAESNQRNAEMMQRATQLELSIDTARSAQVEFKKQVQEWKDTLLRGNDQAAFDKYSKAFNDRSQQTEMLLQKLKDLFGKLGLNTAQVDDALKAHQELGGKYTEALKQYTVSDGESAHRVDALVKGMDRPPTQKIDEIVTYVLDQSNQMMAASAKASQDSYRSACLLLLVAVLLGVALGGAVTLWLVRSITKPLLHALNIAQTVAAGDLTSTVAADGRDETAQLLQALHGMNDSLAQIVFDVRHGTHEINSAATDIANSNMDLSSRTENQASSLEETAAAMEQLTSTVKQNAENAREANTLAATASDVARKGGDVVTQVVETMGSINDSSRKIVDIISVIDGIAFQTNILALNAAVEAARAGEQGRGFAVVAAEVRNLAQRSAAAAKEIKTLIGDSVEKVDAGTRLVDQAGETMGEIVASVRRVSSIIAEISTASAEQTTGLEQINIAIAQMDEVTQRNAALVEESAAAAESLKNLGSALAKEVSVFTIKEGLSATATQQLVAAEPKPPTRTAVVTTLKRPALRSAPALAAVNDSWEQF